MGKRQSVKTKKSKIKSSFRSVNVSQIVAVFAMNIVNYNDKNKNMSSIAVSLYK